MGVAMMETVNLVDMGKTAQAASRQLATLTSDVKNKALLAIADELEARADEVMAENALDIADGRAKGLSDALLDRLLLTEARIAGLAADIRNVAGLPDPVGAELEGRVLPNGLRLSRRRIPIGVLGVIYEARPNVTIDIASLSLKTGNACILRGGSETLRSNIALVQVIHQALAKVDLPLLKYTIMLNGVTQLVLTKIDVMNAMSEIKAAVAYQYGGKIHSNVPYDLNLVEVDPQWHSFAGWESELAAANSFAELPPACRSYIQYLEEFLHVPVTMVSTGPERESLILKESSVQPA